MTGPTVRPQVEAVIAEHPAVAEVAVFGLPNKVLGEVVAAAVVLAPQRQATADQISRWCSGRLAHYKVVAPGNVFLLDHLPKSG